MRLAGFVRPAIAGAVIGVIWELLADAGDCEEILLARTQEGDRLRTEVLAARDKLGRLRLDLQQYGRDNGRLRREAARAQHREAELEARLRRCYDGVRRLGEQTARITAALGIVVTDELTDGELTAIAEVGTVGRLLFHEDRPGFMNVVKPLALGLLAAEATDDPRSICVSLTDEGRRLLHRANTTADSSSRTVAP